MSALHTDESNGGLSMELNIGIAIAVVVVVVVVVSAATVVVCVRKSLRSRGGHNYLCF